jgi:hypothetical protein
MIVSPVIQVSKRVKSSSDDDIIALFLMFYNPQIPYIRSCSSGSPPANILQLNAG